MIKIQFSKQDIHQLDYFRYNHPDPKIQRRFEVLWLKYLGYPHHEIASIANVHHDTVTSYLKLYKEGGLERLQAKAHSKPRSDLHQYKDSIKEDFEKNSPQTIREAASRIEKQTGIRRKATQVSVFMKKLGFKRIKVAHIPAKADVKKQKEFFESLLKPRLDEAKQGKRAVLFMDGAHFVHAVLLGMMWCLTRIFIKSASGRKRFNVLGAIDAVNHQLFTVCNDSYVNASCICEMLSQVAAHYVKIPITIVLDNARYQKCKIVFEMASDLGIELLYLPSYSPNLNLIERLWKYVKQQVLYCKYYETFDEFKDSIETCLKEINDYRKNDMSTPLSLNFHSLEKAVKLAA